MTNYNGPKDAANVFIEAEQEVRKLEKLLGEQLKRRDSAKAYVDRWFADRDAPVELTAVADAGEAVAPPPFVFQATLTDADRRFADRPGTVTFNGADEAPQA